MDVIRLLNSKNRCLERFLTVSDEFLTLVEAGDFSKVEQFHKQRDRILRGFDLYDRKLSECIEKLPKLERTSELSRKAEQALAIKDALVRKIAAIDAQIIEKIEQEKTRLTKEMSASQRTNAAMKKFKSNWVQESGEELDETL